MKRFAKVVTRIGATHWAATAASALLLLGLLSGRAQAQQDRVMLKDGKEKAVKILSEDYDGIRFSVEGGSSGLSWKDVVSIRYANATKYHEAADAFSLGKSAEALPLFEALAADEKLRPVLRHGVLYHLGLVHQKLGDAEKAIARYSELLEEFPKTRYLLPAGNNLLSLFVAKKDPSGAAKILDGALAAAKSPGADASLQVGFDLLRGRLFEEQGKFAEAEKIYEGAGAAEGVAPEVVASVNLGLARCAQRGGRTADADRRYREIVALVGAPSDVLAGAWNGLGDLAIAEGMAKRDPDGLRYAMFAHLRGVVLYVPGPEQPSDEYQRALAGAAKAFRSVGELEVNAERKKLFLDRAKQHRERLAAEYPQSRYLEGL